MDAFGDEVVIDTTQSPDVAGDGHAIIRILFLFPAFRSQPLMLAVVLAGAETTRRTVVDLFAQTKVGDDEPVTADGDQHVARANVAVDEPLVVHKLQSAGQLVHSDPVRWNWSSILSFGPICQIGGAQFESKVPTDQVHCVTYTIEFLIVDQGVRNSFSGCTRN